MGKTYAVFSMQSSKVWNSRVQYVKLQYLKVWSYMCNLLYISHKQNKFGFSMSKLGFNHILNILTYHFNWNRQFYFRLLVLIKKISSFFSDKSLKYK